MASVDALETLGFTRSESRIIIALSETGGSATRALADMGIAQPSISVAVRSLEEKGLLVITKASTGGRGRPKLCYELNHTKAKEEIRERIKKLQDGAKL